MTLTERALLAAFITVCVLFGLMVTFTEPADGAVRCTEDMACWDCETMGNRICGSDRWVNLNGRRLTARQAANRFALAPGCQCITAIRRADGGIDRFRFCR